MLFLGKTLKRFRSEQGISQQELAQKSQLTPSFLSLLENDKRRPSLAVLRRLADALNVAEEAILWDAVELPSELSEHDRRLFETAKMILKRMHSELHANASKKRRKPGAGQHSRGSRHTSR